MNNITITKGSNFIAKENMNNQSMDFIELVGFKDAGIYEWKVTYYERFKRSGYHIINSERFTCTIEMIEWLYFVEKSDLEDLIKSVKENNKIEF